MSNKRRGTEFERQVKKWYEQHGALVIRSAGSFGPADLVVIKHGVVPTLVSCRRTKRFVQDVTSLWKTAELNTLRTLVTDFQVRVVLAWKTPKEWGFHPLV